MRQRARRLGGAAALVAVVPAAARAHVGAPPQPHDLWTAWSAEPAVLGGLAVAAWLYARGVRALWRRAGRGRGIAPWRAGCYAGGLATLALALLSPVDRVSAALFSVHMVQHLLLTMVAAPLVVLGEPLAATLWALPAGARRAVGRWWTRAPAARVARAAWRGAREPLVAWLLAVGALWAWHAPRLYESALRHRGVHALEHGAFFLTSLLFWWVLADRRARRRLGFGPAVLYLFAAGLQCTVLGALIALARRPWYLSHYDTTRPWGLTPLEDQQLAGLIMWVPAGLVYVGALVALFAAALRGREEPPRGRGGLAAGAWPVARSP
ncbi:MAG: cytochrome c oxidase assembly protein [Gemmatimonadaceae bacterium]